MNRIFLKRKNKRVLKKLTKSKLLNETLLKMFECAFENNITPRDACPLCHINYLTYVRWINTGKEDKEDGKENIFVKLYDIDKTASIKREKINFENIQNAAKGGKEFIETRTTIRNGIVEETIIRRQQTPKWQASAWLLERLFPDKYKLDRDIEQNVEKTVKEIKQALLDMDKSMEAPT